MTSRSRHPRSQRSKNPEERVSCNTCATGAPEILMQQGFHAGATLRRESACSPRRQIMMLRNAWRLPVPYHRSPRRWIVALTRVKSYRDNESVAEADATRCRSLLATFEFTES